jgi:hypothetical protein
MQLQREVAQALAQFPEELVGVVSVSALYDGAPSTLFDGFPVSASRAL